MNLLDFVGELASIFWQILFAFLVSIATLTALYLRVDVCSRHARGWQICTWVLFLFDLSRPEVCFSIFSNFRLIERPFRQAEILRWPSSSEAGRQTISGFYNDYVDAGQTDQSSVRQ